MVVSRRATGNITNENSFTSISKNILANETTRNTTTRKCTYLNIQIEIQLNMLTGKHIGNYLISHVSAANSPLYIPYITECTRFPVLLHNHD